MPGVMDIADPMSQAAPVQAPQVHGESQFGEDEFLAVDNVPVFCEHETTTKDGRQIVFGYDELKLVADRCNRRIAESGDYAAISIGHTPSPEAKSAGAPDPDVVGFAGPYRMGVLGKPGQRQRHAILADFHIFKDDVGRFKKHPRRSPELWLEDRYEEMFLDPIALLGAEAPRLDLGLLYSAVFHRGGKSRRVEKYAAVSPGPGNVFVPGDDSTKQPYSGENPMEMQDDVIQRICEAIGQTDEMQFIRQLMAEKAGGGGGELAGEAPAPSLESATPPAAPLAAPEAGPPVESPAGPPVGDPAAGPPPGPMDAPPPAPPAPPEAGPPGATPPPVPGPEEEPEKLGAMAGMVGKKVLGYEAADEMDEEEFEEYCAYRANRYAAGDGEGSNASGSYDKDLGGSSQEHTETSGSTPYEAGTGSVDGASANPSGNGSADGDMSVSTGTVDADGSGGKMAASTYAKNGHADRVQYQKLQMQLRKESDRSTKLEADLQVEKFARIDAQRHDRLQNMVLEGWALEPDDEMARLGAAAVNDEQFDAHVKAMTENYKRMPTMILPYSADTAAADPSRPGGRIEQEKYSRAASEIAHRVCMEKINAGGEQPDFVQVLADVKAGKHGDVAVA